MTDFLQSKIPSPLELRAKLEELVRADLLGPAGGPEEIVDERNVRDRYIVGRLAPRGQHILPDEHDDLPVGGDADDQDGKAESGLGQPETLERHISQALEAARLCASDPLCAERQPSQTGRTLHAAACHACLFAPETSCERGNKYLDRSTLVPTVEHDDLAFFE